MARWQIGAERASLGCIPFGVKHLLPSGTSPPFPGGARSNGVSGLPRPCARIAATSGPHCSPLAIPRKRARLPSGWFRCRLSGGRVFNVVLFFIMRIQCGALRCVSSAIPPKISTQKRPGAAAGIRFLVGGERPEADHVGFGSEQGVGTRFGPAAAHSRHRANSSRKRRRRRIWRTLTSRPRR